MFSFMANTSGHFYKNFQGFTYCSVFKVRVVVFRDSQINIAQHFLIVNNFFKKNKLFFQLTQFPSAAYDGWEFELPDFIIPLSLDFIQ